MARASSFRIAEAGQRAINAGPQSERDLRQSLAIRESLRDLGGIVEGSPSPLIVTEVIVQATELEQRPSVLLGSHSAGQFDIANSAQGNGAGSWVRRRCAQARDRLLERLLRRTSHADHSRPLTLATCVEAVFFGTKRVRPISAHPRVAGLGMRA